MLRHKIFTGKRVARKKVTHRHLVIALLAVCLFGLSPCVVSTSAYADSRSDLVEAQKRKQREISQARQQLAGVKDEIAQAYVQILETENQIATAQIELRDAQDALGVARREAERVTSQLEAARGELETIRHDIDEGNKKIEDARDSLGVLARAQYRGDTTPSTMELLVGSSSASDFLNSFATSHAITRTQTTALTEVERLTARNKTREARQVDVEAQIIELKKQADALVAQCAEREKVAANKKAELDGLHQQLTQRTKRFEAYSARLNSQISQKEAESAQLQARIAAIDSGNRTSGVNVNRNGKFILPMVPGSTYVTSNYGYRWHPVRGGWRFHSGVDFSVACGVPQYAPANATVAYIGYDSSRGNYIILNLGMINGHSWQVWTLHLQSGSIGVRVGQHLTQGQYVARTGATGGVTGCHVHQEVRIDGKAVNPLDYIIR